MQAERQPQVILCIPVAGADHFSVVSRVWVIAARLAVVPADGVKRIIRPEELQDAGGK